ncbi:hypothetical protein HFN_1000 [Helicobacter fennelliae MRY12-0050]|uniref:Uncharacterized protein n=1 Tax=Helicobacter fennelliae MRY12-0050 TaxID=1325130 RepID=T1D0M0_9HELI|nr:hypothetical protein HFN_1000 [Helicobacter fennelliae MRY12-0050]
MRDCSRFWLNNTQKRENLQNLKPCKNLKDAGLVARSLLES